jgi:drug/metabolite transporter (DMT)-like permease
VQNNYSTVQRRAGVFLVAASAFCWSLAGLFERAADVDSATLIFLSSAAAFAGLGLASVLHFNAAILTKLANFGRPELLYISASTITTVSCVIALQHTTVANVMAIYATLPFAATAIAFLWLYECVSRRFVIAGLGAVTGAVLTATAAASQNDGIGTLAAFIMTASYACQLVLVKRYPAIDILLVSTVSAAVSAIAAAPFVEQWPLGTNELAASSLYGLVSYGLGTVLALAGSRLIKSGEAGFISMLDVVLSPLWVWIIFSEQPPIFSVIGGTMVLASLAWYLADEGRSSAQSAAGSIAQTG